MPFPGPRPQAPARRYVAEAARGQRQKGRATVTPGALPHPARSRLDVPLHQSEPLVRLGRGGGKGRSRRAPPGTALPLCRPARAPPHRRRRRRRRSAALRPSARPAGRKDVLPEVPVLLLSGINSNGGGGGSGNNGGRRGGGGSGPGNIRRRGSDGRGLRLRSRAATRRGAGRRRLDQAGHLQVRAVGSRRGGGGWGGGGRGRDRPRPPPPPSRVAAAAVSLSAAPSALPSPHGHVRAAAAPPSPPPPPPGPPRPARRPGGGLRQTAQLAGPGRAAPCGGPGRKPAAAAGLVGDVVWRRRRRRRPIAGSTGWRRARCGPSLPEPRAGAARAAAFLLALALREGVPCGSAVQIACGYRPLAFPEGSEASLAPYEVPWATFYCVKICPQWSV